MARDANDIARDSGPEGLRKVWDASVNAACRGNGKARQGNGRVRIGSPKRTTIRVKNGTLHEIATAAEDALIKAGAPLYVRGDGIVRPVLDEVEAATLRMTKAARLAPVSIPMITDHLSRVAYFERYQRTQKRWAPADPPKAIAEIILSRDGEWRFPRLAGVITTPTLRPDGSILATTGYDPATRLLLLEPPALPDIPARPSKADAKFAIEILAGLLGEFPFKGRGSRAVALSGMITPVVRGAMTVAPLHVARAHTSGSGKSYLVDVFAAIATGQRCPVIAPGPDEAETEKRLAAKMLAGHPLISLDNLNGELGGDALAQYIERPVVEIRPLGASKIVRIENRATLYATGNNLVLRGDIVRRAVTCTLDPNLEQPELRQFIGDPFNAVLAARGRYVAAALTIVRAYLAAGCPDPAPALASFEDWSRIVRSALLWLGEDDPVATMEAMRGEDPVLAGLRAVIAAWVTTIGLGTLLTVAEIRNRANMSDDFEAALRAVASNRKGELNSQRLGKWLGSNRGRIIDSCKIIDGEDSHRKQKVWGVELV